jgi:hypothetical protein
VRDASKFPREGVVRIDDELFEYVKNGNSLKIREMPPSHWQPLKRWKLGTGRGRIEPPREPPKRPGGRGNEASPQEAATQEPQMVVGPGLLADSAALADGAEGLGQAGPGVPPTPAVDLTTMRAPGNRRGSVPSAHTQGARVALHGYSLPMRRKIRDLKTGAEFQVPENDAQRLIWGSAGLRSLEMLPAFNFPNDISGIVHIDFDEQDVAGSDGDYVVPLFHLDSGNAIQGGLFMDFMTSMTTLGSRNAADYFQSKGVLTVSGEAFFYRKEPLPPQYVQAQNKFSMQIRQPQTMGLRILADYEPVAGGGGLRRWKALKESNRRYRSFPGVAVINRPVTQRSLLVAGGIRGLYPETGVIEMRGSPTPWEATYPAELFRTTRVRQEPR